VLHVCPNQARSSASINEITRAELAYLELFSDDDHAPKVWRGHAIPAATVEQIRSSISRGILGKAIAEGRTIETSSAVQDARFADLESVRQRDIGAVLSIPIGTQLAVGALYIQSTARLSSIDRQRAELFAQQLAVLTVRLTPRKAERLTLHDEVQRLQERRVREALERYDWNIAEVARVLGVGRAFVYRTVRRLT
jgi:DNA-binding NtrC family response regulator